MKYQTIVKSKNVLVKKIFLDDKYHHTVIYVLDNDGVCISLTRIYYDETVEHQVVMGHPDDKSYFRNVKK